VQRAFVAERVACRRNLSGRLGDIHPPNEKAVMVLDPPPEDA
jgi:hypothetical protein